MTEVKDPIRLRGEVKVVVKDKDGNIKHETEDNNLIVNAGLAGIATRIGLGSLAAFDYLAVGSGTTAAAAGNTALETEITDSGLGRSQVTPTQETTSVTNDTLVLSKTWTVTGSKNVSEVGILNAGSGGTLLGRRVFSAIPVENSDTLTITYKIVVS